MALTMTRTRTQTTLTRLVKALARVNGELAYLAGLLEQYTAGSEQRVALEVKRERVAADREALCTTIRQYDPALDPDAVGAASRATPKYNRGRAPAYTIRYGDHQAGELRYPRDQNEASTEESSIDRKASCEEGGGSPEIDGGEEGSQTGG